VFRKQTLQLAEAEEKLGDVEIKLVEAKNERETMQVRKRAKDQ